MRAERIKPNIPIALYHIMTRTAQRSFLLDEQVKREILSRWLEILTRIFYVKIHNHAYLDNHYHITMEVHKPGLDEADLKDRFEELQTHLTRPEQWENCDVEKFYKRLTDLSSFMQSFNWRVARESNKQHETDGHLWGARFKSRILEDEAALQVVATYIEQNAVRAKVTFVPKGSERKRRVRKPSEYKWCTAGKLKRALDRDEELEAPNFGIYKKIKSNLERARIYVSHQDYLSQLLTEPKLRKKPPPSEIAALSIADGVWDDIRKELTSGRPSNWSSPGYGSKTFERCLKEHREIPSKSPPS